MEFLCSNIEPFKTKYKTFSDQFYELFYSSQRVDIAVGYVSVESLAEIKSFLEQNPEQNGVKRVFNLTIGMHYLEGFTRPQYNAALSLNSYLQQEGIGEILVVRPFKFHGKMYLFSRSDKPFAGIIGSANLGSIVRNMSNLYDSSIVSREETFTRSLQELLRELNATSASNIAESKNITFIDKIDLLQGIEGVQQVSSEELLFVMSRKTSVSFEIPLKTTEKSNLNCYFGRGRESKHGILPRHWYEVEIIVSTNILQNPSYPYHDNKGKFTVVTDDGWKFDCIASGANGKNLRSAGELTILGKWIKGRLENADVLKMGDYVTDATLDNYGRNTITMTKTSLENVWYIDFSVKR